MVCTENVCTSPMAAALLRHHLARAGIDAVVTSAGIKPSMRPIHPDAVRALTPWGIDLSQHASREASEAVVVADGADLVITMSRAQLRRLVANDRQHLSSAKRPSVQSAAGGAAAQTGLADTDYPADYDEEESHNCCYQGEAPKPAQGLACARVLHGPRLPAQRPWPSRRLQPNHVLFRA